MDYSHFKTNNKRVLLFLTMFKLYQFGIHFYGLCLKVLSPFHKKAKQWTVGQRTVFNHLPNITNKKILWIHCASLGEFLQAKPLIRIIKNCHPNYYILITFFSPSGYLNANNNPIADCISYLPLDTSKNAKRFIKTIKPSMALFIKNELWPNYLNELQKNNISTFVVSALFRKDQFFFKPYGKWQLSILKKLNHFFVQDLNSKRILQSHSISQVSVCGDTRFDSIKENVQSFEELPIIKAFKNNHDLIVCGSTYLKDSLMLFNISQRNPNLKFIIAPHEMDICHQLKQSFLRYSQANAENVKNQSVILIDNVGMLSKLYAYADLSYVGGGFGNKGLHNILEPLAFGIPTIFGPNYHAHNEAKEVIGFGIGFSIKSEAELENKINKLLQKTVKKSIINEYCNNKIGASKFIYNQLKDSF